MTLEIEQLRGGLIQGGDNQQPTQRGPVQLEHKSHETADAAALADLKAIQDLTQKLAALVSEDPARIPVLTNYWLSAGEKGYGKVAQFIDAAHSFNLGASTATHLEIPPEHRRKMRNTFAAMAEQSNSLRRFHLEEVYWDFISAKTIGPKVFDQPFSYVTELKLDKAKVLLQQQTPAVRALVALHLPDESRASYLQGLDFEEKKRLVVESINIDKVKAVDLETTNEMFKFQLTKHAVDEDTINVRSLLPDLLSGFSAMEEVSVLLEVSKQLGPRCAFLKTDFPSLAFLTDWPEAKAKVFLQTATSEEVLALALIAPSLATYLIQVSPPTVAEIVRDDITRPDAMSLEAKEAAVKKLRAKLLKFVNAGGIDLQQTFQQTTGVARAA